MSETTKPRFLKTSNYKALSRHYNSDPIALYTGAGVSCSENPDYGLGGWDALMRDILVQHFGNVATVVSDYDTAATKHAEEPWKLADWVNERVGKEQFKRDVVKIIQREQNFPERQPSSSNKKKGSNEKKEYKQLGRKFLRQAPTLNSVCTFCAKIIAELTGTKNLTYQIATNPRVRAIITSNYDPFLEAASSAMFIRHIYKPVGAYGSSVGRLHQIPVFHIHGYVPYPEIIGARQQAEIPSMVDPVLTSEDYEKAWEDHAYNFTMGPQIHILRHYTTLFVGFSFRDKWVNDLLKELNEERVLRGKKRLYHYALMKESTINEKGKSFFDDLGIKPIGVMNYNQIPEFFRSLYNQALLKDYKTNEIPIPLVEKKLGKNKDRKRMELIKNTIIDDSPKKAFLSAEDYWEHLYNCRNRTVRIRKKHK